MSMDQRKLIEQLWFEWTLNQTPFHKYGNQTEIDVLLSLAEYIVGEEYQFYCDSSRSTYPSQPDDPHETLKWVGAMTLGSYLRKRFPRQEENEPNEIYEYRLRHHLNSTYHRQDLR